MIGLTRSWRIVKDLGIYLAVLLAVILALDYQKSKTLQSFRNEINGAATALCYSSAQQDALGKYNSALDALIGDLEKRKDENIQRGDWAKALINADTAARLRAAKIKQQPANCERPLLPGR